MFSVISLNQAVACAETARPGVSSRVECGVLECGEMSGVGTVGGRETEWVLGLLCRVPGQGSASGAAAKGAGTEWAFTPTPG